MVSMCSCSMLGRTWLIEMTGESSRGIEYFSVDDVTGEVSYIGSSLYK